MKYHIQKPLFSWEALKLKALSGQILIVLDILVLAKEECEKDTKILLQVFNKRGADISNTLEQWNAPLSSQTERHIA